MKAFEEYLSQFNEVGEIEKLFPSIVNVVGLPKARAGEVVVFESGDMGQVISLKQGQVEVLLFTNKRLAVGDRVARTGELFKAQMGKGVLGAVVDPLGNLMAGKLSEVSGFESRVVDVPPPPLMKRALVEKQFETGVSVVDMVVPIGIGQRELVLGDRKIGKTEFLKQAMLSHASKGGIVVYAGIAKRQKEIADFASYLSRYQIDKNTVGVMTSSRQPAGLVYQTPYVAMTIAEYFRDQGMDVLLVLDDLTIHAKYYREVMLSAKRFPGRSAYPGDIFFVHARLMERAGNFEAGSITLLPVAETVLSDISGYIQTNLMSMTDGHIFFDSELYNQGRRPAVNPFLSVTRVGHQAQTPLFQTMSRELSTFLADFRQTEELVHFGGEIGEEAKKVLSLGAKILVIFNQGTVAVMRMNIAGLVVAGVFGGMWDQVNLTEFQARYLSLAKSYATDENYKRQVDQVITSVSDFGQLVGLVSNNKQLLGLG